MAGLSARRVAASIAGGILGLAAAGVSVGAAQAQTQTQPVAPVKTTVSHARPARTAAARPLTIRRRVERPVVIAAAPSFAYEVPQHRWNDTRLYYFGPFRTGGEVFYGDQAGDPITRGNAQLGMISGYGGARGGFGGPHFDSVGGFHNGPGPDAKIDADYASGSLSRPDYGDVVPRYPSVKARLEALNEGIVPRKEAASLIDRASGRRLIAEGRSLDASETAKAAFAAPVAHADPNEGLPGGRALPSLGEISGDPL